MSDAGKPGVDEQSARAGAQDEPHGRAEDASRASSPASLEGATVWLLTGGLAERAGWADALEEEVNRRGARRFERVGVAGVLGRSARGLVEDGADFLARGLRLQRASGEHSAREAISAGRPDVILVDAPQYLSAIHILRDTLPMQPLIVALVATLDVPDAWCDVRADGWVVANELVADALRLDPAAATVELGGPPIPADFARSIDRVARRSALSIGEDERVITVDVETCPAPQIEEIVRSVRESPGTVRWLFYTGENASAAHVLRESAAAHGVSAAMYGYTPALADYVCVSDVLVVGAANPRLGAYLAQGIPLISVGADMGRNVAAWSGALVPLPTAAPLRHVAAEIGTSGVAADHAGHAAELVSPTATADTVSAIARLLDRASDLKKKAPAAFSERPGQASEERGGEGSAFEQIGVSAGSAAQTDTRNVPARMSRETAKRELARLILDERRVEAELASVVKVRDRWLGRETLSDEAGDAEMLAYARTQVAGAFADVDRLQAELAELVRRRQEIRASTAPLRTQGGASRPLTETGAPDMERRYRELEMKRDIERLRAKAKGGA